MCVKNREMKKTSLFVGKRLLIFEKRALGVRRLALGKDDDKIFLDVSCRV